MKLNQYAQLVCGNSTSEETGSEVLNRLRRLGRILRAITQEAHAVGYTLEEIANIDLENN